MKVRVEDERVRSRSGNKNGRDWNIRTQSALLDGERIRGQIELTLSDDQAPYPVGEYEIDFEAAVRIGDFGSIMLQRNLPLRPISSAKSATPFPGSKVA